MCGSTKLDLEVESRSVSCAVSAAQTSEFLKWRSRLIGGILNINIKVLGHNEPRHGVPLGALYCLGARVAPFLAISVDLYIWNHFNVSVSHQLITVMGNTLSLYTVVKRSYISLQLSYITLSFGRPHKGAHSSRFYCHTSALNCHVCFCMGLIISTVRKVPQRYAFHFWAYNKLIYICMLWKVPQRYAFPFIS